jgi:hypothetical protein
MGGTIAKPKGLKPGAIKPKATPKPKASRSPATSRLRPGELMNAVARPVGTMARPRRGENPYYAFSVKDSRNIDQAKKILEGMGTKVLPRDWSGDTAVARGTLGKNQIFLNPNSQYWENPKRRSTEERRSGFSSTSHPLGLLYHEMGHNRHRGGSSLWYLSGKAKSWNQGIVPYSDWAKSVSPLTANQQSPLGRIKLGKRMEALAKRVSRYATRNPVEFVAETYAGLKTGRRYDFQVMRAYREAMGLSPNPAPRRRSRLRRPKP